ncbi:MAG: hypothetical protein J6W26_04860 [Bacteroidales bacterium]|nr:hypothetical protein [Bacteroidales bacterium]
MKQVVKKLQNEAMLFLSKMIVLDEVIILPKEIEVYYYELNGVFKDESVHRNELQKDNQNHFYVHRKGTKRSNLYTGGNRGGLDFVASDDESIYYAYLIRSAMVNDEITIGPNNVLKRILDVSKLEKEELENKILTLVPNDIQNDVLFSNRINLGNNTGEYQDYELRAVMCDEWFRESKYLDKEKMIVSFLYNQVHQHGKSQGWALEYAKEKMGYVPSAIKEL